MRDRNAKHCTTLKLLFCTLNSETMSVDAESIKESKSTPQNSSNAQTPNATLVSGLPVETREEKETSVRILVAGLSLSDVVHTDVVVRTLGEYSRGWNVT